MLIGIDGNEANIKNRVGVNVYAFEILWGLRRLQDKQKQPEHNFIIFLKEPPLCDLPKANVHWKYLVLPGKGLWVLTKLMPHLFMSREKPSLLFSPSHYTVPFSPIPKVCSIMDLGYLKFSGQFKKSTFWQLKYWSAISIRVSKYIISISKATAEDIVRHYPFAAKKVRVVYLGFNQAVFNNSISKNDVRRILRKYSIVDDYVLFLSTLKPSKNIEGLLEAFSKIKGVKLVIAGKKGWMYTTIFNKIKSLHLQDRVIFTDFIPEEDKPALMAGARVFVAPSFWEGFGLHVLEAMACGTPVVVGNTGSLPEIVGKAGILVDPNNVNSIVNGINKVINMPEKGYNNLVEAQIKQAMQFSWEKTAEETLKILETIN